MQHTAILLNVIYITAAISAGKRGQQWLLALGLLELLQQTRPLPGVIYYSAVFIACEKGLCWHQALGLLAWVQQTAICQMSFLSQSPSVLVRRASNGNGH